MFEKLVQMMQNMQNSQIPFNPAQFGDPVANQTGWRPAKGGGSNFRTFKLVKVNAQRMEFKTTVGAFLFALIFALPGIGMLIFLFPQVNWSSLTLGSVIPLLLGLVFAGAGGYLLYVQLLPIVFDKQIGFFWKERRPQAEMLTQQSAAKYTRLEMIHALQIIAEYLTSKNGGYYSYELNLVLNNGDRINVVDHGNLNKLTKDAEVLAEFLGIPIWDATIPQPAVNAFSMTGNP